MKKYKFTPKPMCLSLPDKDIHKLDVLADAQGTSRSEIVRRLIKGKRLPKPQKPRFPLKSFLSYKREL